MTVPEEGAPFWSDVMVVANKSANPDQAHMFINYIMRPEVIARISQQLGYPAPHKAHGVNQGSSDEQDSRQMLMRSAEAQQFFTITPASEPTERVRARVWRSIKNTEQ
jgi:putrescine transport system substrate-binding protein